MDDKNWYWKPGSWNVLCPVCGFKFKSDELKLRWDGEYVCAKDWEPRHPQDLFRVVTKETSIPWSKPDSTTFDHIAEITVADSPYAVPPGTSAPTEDLTVRIIRIDASGGSVTINLPWASVVSAAGEYLEFKRTDTTSANTVTINSSGFLGGDRINNGTTSTSVILKIEQKILLYSDNATRWTVQRG